MMTSFREETRTDRGATVILVAISMLLLLGIAAIAVDLAALRSDIRSDRLASDAAATAGAAEIDPLTVDSAVTACEVAWAYLLLNLGDEGPSLSPPSCTLFSGMCTETQAAKEATASAGPYSFVIVYPVPDSHRFMTDQLPNAQIDGVQCQRLGVSVERVRDYTFARVLGATSGSPQVRSVARFGVGPGADDFVPLLLLEPISCDALFTSGQGKITVSYFTDATTDVPGKIVVDSTGSKTNNPNACIGAANWTIDSKGNQNGWIRAIPTPSGIPSAILSYALSADPLAVPPRSYDPGDLTDPVDPLDISDLTEPAISYFRLYPRPRFTGSRITRAPIDHRYNCKAVYPDYLLDLGNPGLGGIPIAACPDPTAPHIDNLVFDYTGLFNPGGFSQWSLTYPCEVTDVNWPAPLPPISVTGDWWVDCEDGFIVNNSQVVTFDDGDVVFDGDIDLRSHGSLVVNPSKTADRVIYVRENGIIKKGSQSSIFFEQTLVYLEKGRLSMVGGSGGLTWTAPLGGPYEDLALWSESTLDHDIGGQSGNTLEGTFFTPLAKFTLTGQGTQVQTDAQFITRRLEVKGDAEVRMTPNPERSTPIPTRDLRLIR